MLDTFLTFLIAGGIGGLVGAQRELVKVQKKSVKKSHVTFAGIRSYAFICVLGALCVYTGKLLQSPVTFVITGSMFVGLLILIGYVYSSWNGRQYGLTSELSAIMVFFLGVLTMAGDRQIAVILGILLAVVLTSRTKIKHLFKKMSEKELATTLKFAVIAFIILPLLPDKNYSLADMLHISSSSELLSMHFFNPYAIWFFVVLMSGVSYIGYILSKFIGTERGVGVSGVLGGLVSSTAVTSVMSQQSKKYPNIVHPFVFATLMANMIMFIRVMFIVTVFHVTLLPILFIPLGIMLTVMLILIFVTLNRGDHAELTEKKQKNADLQSPFQIGPALKFAAFIVAVKFLAGWALVYQDVWGEYVLYAVSFFSGFADVDAITQDMSVRSLGGEIAGSVATTAIIIATITNTTVKMGIAFLFGGKTFGKIVSLSLLIVLLSGITSLVFI